MSVEEAAAGDLGPDPAPVPAAEAGVFQRAPSAPEGDDAQGLSALHEVPMRVSVVVGAAELTVRDLLRLGRGAVLELDRKVGDMVDVLVNDRLVAKGEIVAVGDRLAVSMTSLCRVEAAPGSPGRKG